MAWATAANDVPVTQNTVDDNIGNGTVEFATTGSSDVTIRFTPTCDTRPQGMMPLNGFTLDSLGPDVQFYQAESNEPETAHTAHVGVVLSQALSETVSVDYAVTGGTAVNGLDYVVSDGTLVFDPYDTTETIDITIIDDGEDDAGHGRPPAGCSVRVGHERDRRK